MYEQHSDNHPVASHILSYTNGVDRNQTLRWGQKYTIQTATDTGCAAPTSRRTKEQKPDTQTTTIYIKLVSKMGYTGHRSGVAH